MLQSKTTWFFRLICTILLIASWGCAEVAAQTCVTAGAVPDNSRSYVVTYVSRDSTVTDPRLLSLQTCQVMTTIQYVDGLGRPSQTVQVKGNPTATRDVIQPFAYDAYGRQSVTYLTYTTASGTPGSYRADALKGSSGYGNSAQKAFYGQASQNYNTISSPYANTVFELSGLNRVKEQGAPGDAWQPAASRSATSGRTVTYAYKTNNNIAFSADTQNSFQVARYKVDIAGNQGRRLSRPAANSIANAATYDAGSLSLTITCDENWVAGRGGTVEEYKDNEGHVVLKRTFNYITAQTTPVAIAAKLEVLSTYYVYDDLGNLAFVLPPMSYGDNTQPIAQAVLDNLCYQYKYDDRNRLVAKKIPGKGWEFMIYNKLDQVVATQDSAQRNKTPLQQASFVKYDALGRGVMTGIFNVAGSSVKGQSYRADMQMAAYSETAHWESRQYLGTTGTTDYSTSAYPQTDFTPLVINYYDNYTAIPGRPGIYTPAAGTYSPQVTGMLTATKTAVLNSPTALLLTVHWYDDKGRETNTFSQHYKGGSYTIRNYDAAATTYNFANEVTTTKRKHYIYDASQTDPQLKLTVWNRYLYDHMGRKVKTWQLIKNAADVTTEPTAGEKTLISKIDYNELGQLWKKSLHNTTDTTSNAAFRQVITYGYNERGWLLKSSSPLFEEELQYNQGVAQNGMAPAKYYNGNIASQSWGTEPSPNTNTYVYGYDQLNRLTKGISNTGNNERDITYDLMGNIKTLNRYAGATTQIDQLTYAYSPNSNQLASVTDGTSNTGGQKPGTATYGYDANGNLSSDNSRGITTTSPIVYNLLNLPQSIPGLNTTYVYDANGKKLRRGITGGTPPTTDYVNGIQYEGTTLSFIQTEEGRALQNGTIYNYEYSLTDHLGNSRVNFDTGSGTTANRVQMDDYYPFGMDIPGTPIRSPQNLYLYNNKELQQNGLNMYDYGARFYDPVIARWTVPDPMAEKSFSLTPFRYAFNNPVRVVDPNGAYEVDGHFWTVYLMLTMMGNKNAFNISNWTEWPDQTMYPSGDAASYNNSWLQPLSQQRIHALTEGFSNLERNSSYGDAVTASTSSELGIALHRLGDSYAHSIFGNEGRMYGGAFFSTGHAGHTGAEDPDAISNRPWLYRMYADRLAGALKERFGYKGGLDMFTFDYVAGSGGNTAQNSAIFETEISIRQGLGSFSVDGNQVDAVNGYIKSSNGHFGRSVQAKSVYTDVDVYNRDADGNWVKTKSEKRTFVTIQ